ncbi:MAG: LysR family transcriptional regulator, partial [Oscillospiraceae bacterium]|nr:LysR family transcriptional regulator [Oscillospiraceae bacterium]
MNITRYQIFLKVAERGNFTRAAEELGFTQSTVSHAIQTLEADVGLPLLARNRSGVTLTADGRVLLPYITAICNAQHRMEEAAIDLRGLEKGFIRLA